MRPEDLDVIERDGRSITAVPDRFAAVFYDTLFDVAPDTRNLFPADMADQRGRLVGELAILITAAAAWRDADTRDAFVGRARRLGARHGGYGVRGEMYDAVEVALIGAVSELVDDFDDEHERAWRQLFRLVADAMQDGAHGAGHGVDVPDD